MVSGLGSGAYSAKLLTGTRQRCSGLSHARQCGDEVLRMFVTGGPPVRGGGGMPQRISTISRSPAASRMTGAGVIRKYAGHRRQIAFIAADDPEEVGYRGLVGGDRIEIAHICLFVSFWICGL
jgi:hypothetical protein